MTGDTGVIARLATGAGARLAIGSVHIAAGAAPSTDPTFTVGNVERGFCAAVDCESGV